MAQQRQLHLEEAGRAEKTQSARHCSSVVVVQDTITSSHLPINYVFFLG